MSTYEYTPEQRIAKFWAKVDKSSGDDACWNWKAFINPGGYGFFWYKGKVTLAHRVSWEINRGEIPNGTLILHKCDNRACVNPAHLFLGSQQDNVDDMIRKGRKVNVTGDRHWTNLYPDKRVKGEAQGGHKLCGADVQEARRLYAQGGISHRQLAERFNVGHTAMGDILNRHTWKHLNDSD